jgi:hypothetical protein
MAGIFGNCSCRKRRAGRTVFSCVHLERFSWQELFLHRTRSCMDIASYKDAITYPRVVQWIKQSLGGGRHQKRGQDWHTNVSGTHLSNESN